MECLSAAGPHPEHFRSLKHPDRESSDWLNLDWSHLTPIRERNPHATHYRVEESPPP